VSQKSSCGACAVGGVFGLKNKPGGSENLQIRGFSHLASFTNTPAFHPQKTESPIIAKRHFQATRRCDVRLFLSAAVVGVTLRSHRTPQFLFCVFVERKTSYFFKKPA